MKNFILWGMMGLFGVGLIFNGSIRNDYYTAFSYLFPNNSTYLQSLADTTRLGLGLIMTLSVLNIFSGLLFKILSLIGFVIYSVIINQQFILSPSLNKVQNISSVAIHLVLIFLFMDSIVTKIISLETKSSKEKTKQIIENIKSENKKIDSQPQKSHKNKSQQGTQKVKSQKQIKTDKKAQQKPKNS